MKSSTHLIRFRRLLILGAAVAAIGVPTAGAMPQLDDPGAGTVVSHTTPAGLKADGLRMQGIAQVYQQLQSATVPDVFERYAAAHPYGAGLSVSEATRPPDVADAAAQQKFTTPRDVLDAVGQTSPNQVGLAWQYLHDSGQIAAVSGGHSTDVPDAFERYAAAHPYGKGLNLTQSSVVNRPPDITDTALKIQYSSGSTGQSQGFDWKDWGIGIGSGLALALLLGIGLMIGRQHRHSTVQPA